MERAPDLKLNPHELTVKEQRALIGIIVLFHVVGIAGFYLPAMHQLFLKLVPWHLLLMLALIVISHRPMEIKFMVLVLILFIAGFAAEWIGVHTGRLFGSYTYGNTLGWQLAGIPLCICINWFILVYSAGVLMQRSRIRSRLIRVLTGALILVLLDLLIEQVAVRFDYWHWTGDVIPLKNYACWFLVSGVMLFVFEKFGFKKQSIVAPVFLLVQFVFFLVFNLL